MRKITLTSTFLFVVFWLLLGAYFVGAYQADWLPLSIKKLSIPKSTAELGDSFAVLDGLLSSVAVVLGLVAILLQGRELKASTHAQLQQAHALSLQIKQQENSNKLSAYAARLQFLISEMERLDIQIEKLAIEVKSMPDSELKTEKWNIIKNSRALHVAHKKQSKEIDQKIQAILC